MAQYMIGVTRQVIRTETAMITIPASTYGEAEELALAQGTLDADFQTVDTVTLSNRITSIVLEPGSSQTVTFARRASEVHPVYSETIILDNGEEYSPVAVERINQTPSLA